MTEYTCDSSGCGMRATTHFVQAEKRKVAQTRHLCREHGRALLLDYQRSSKPPMADTPHKDEGGVCFDVDFVFFDNVPDQYQYPCQLNLVEVGGTRQLGLGTGPYEGAALRLELQRYQSPRPRTHQAMAAAISALSGRLRHVMIDKFFPSQQTYEAKLHIDQGNANMVVDVRPSDAIILAVICDVPILVSKEVLATLAAERKQ